jgi:hypothetical protein
MVKSIVKEDVIPIVVTEIFCALYLLHSGTLPCFDSVFGKKYGVNSVEMTEAVFKSYSLKI